MFDASEKRHTIGKWVVGVVTCCILIYLGFGHIGKIAGVVASLANIIKPLLIGLILALIINVPMSSIECWLHKKTKLQKGIRSLAILLALILIIGIFVAVAVLVIPELIETVKLLVQIAAGELDQLALLKTDSAFMEHPIRKFISQINIDWNAVKVQLETWFKNQNGSLVNSVGSMVSNVISFCIGFVFAIYILSGKEKLKEQSLRLVRAWLPQKFGAVLIHIASVFSKTFRLFIAGQATEAIILGTLCMIGMLILRIPYAPMVGALVGVTALIPIVGAFVGTIVGAIMIVTVDPFKALVFVIFLLILQQIEGNLIYPRVVGAKINLPAMWVLAAVTVGGNLGGPIGMLLGVPMTSALYILLREATKQRELHKLT